MLTDEVSSEGSRYIGIAGGSSPGGRMLDMTDALDKTALCTGFARDTHG